MKWLQLSYKYLTIIIVMHVVLVVAGCSNTSQPDKQNSMKLSEVVGDKITIKICNKTISIPKKPITMIGSFIASNPIGYQSVEVPLAPVDKIYLYIRMSEFNSKAYDVFSQTPVVAIYCDDEINDTFFSIGTRKLIKVADLPDLGLSQFKVEKAMVILEDTYFFPIDTVSLSDGFYIRCQPRDRPGPPSDRLGQCYMTGVPIEGIGMRIEFSDLRKWRKYKEVFEGLITVEEK